VWALVGLGVAVLGLLVYLSVSDHGFRTGLQHTAALAAWAVAAGTLVLASATFQLARRARDEAEAVRKEAVQVGDQVALQREQMDAVQQPVVYPVTPADWALGAGQYAGRRNEVLVIANGGPGVALNVTGRLMRRPPAGAGVIESALYAGNIGPGAQQDARLEAAWERWESFIGFLTYSDLLGRSWITDFRGSIAVGGHIAVESEPPRLAEAAGPEYPPPEWNQPQ
jgi:hypothetical protein